MKTQRHSIRENSDPPLLSVQKGHSGWNTTLWVSLDVALREQITAWPSTPTINPNTHHKRHTNSHTYLLSAPLSHVLSPHISSLALPWLWLSFDNTLEKYILKGSISKVSFFWSFFFFFFTRGQEQISERGQGWWMETDRWQNGRPKNEKEKRDSRGRGGRTRYCLSVMVQGGLQLLGNNRGTEDGRDPAACLLKVG